MLSRRGFLIATGAVALTGGGAAAVIESDRSLRHRVGLERSPDAHVPDAKVPRRSGTLQSRHMGRPVSWMLSTPRGPLLGAVVCLHGRNNTHRFAFNVIHLDDVAASLGLPIAVASVDGGADSYWHARADGTDAMRMLLEEFIPFVERTVGTRARALLGWSMGGYGALLAAERQPHRFRVVTAASPALWRRAADAATGAFDGADDYRRNNVFTGVDRLADVMVRVDCGTGDPFYSADRHFSSLLRARHVASFGRGYHDAAYWRSVAPRQLRTIGNALRS